MVDSLIVPRYEMITSTILVGHAIVECMVLIRSPASSTISRNSGRVKSPAEGDSLCLLEERARCAYVMLTVAYGGHADVHLMLPPVGGSKILRDEGWRIAWGVYCSIVVVLICEGLARERRDHTGAD